MTSRHATREAVVGSRSKRFGFVVPAIALAAVVAFVAPAGALGTSFVVVTGGPTAATLRGVTALSTSDVWAVGSFSPTGSGYRHAGLEPYAEHFDGTRWTETPVAGTQFNDDVLTAVSGKSSNDVWAVGSRKRTSFKSPVTTITYHWDGRSWSEVATPAIDGTRYSFAAVSAAASNDVWAVGTAATAPSTALHPLAAHWNGSTWSRVTLPAAVAAAGGELVGVSARAANDAWAVGAVNGKTLALHWNGTTWSTMATKDVPPQRTGASVVDTFTAVTAIAANNVWAVGYATDTVSGSNLPNRTIVEHWDGVQWTLTTAPSPTGHPTLTGVAAASASDVWAVGSGWSDQSVGVPVAKPIYLHFDGTKWVQVTSPANVGSSDNILNAVSAVSTGDVWAVGVATGPLIERRV
jgi:hypothetical protein